MAYKTKKSAIHWAADTNPGMVRRRNEDFFLARPDLGLWVVCDGLGGHRSGEIASRICARTVARQIAKGATLQSSIRKAHDAVWRMEGCTPPESDIRPGSTVAALLICKKKWHIAWVGDSRIWLFDPPHFHQITEDHTVSRQLAEWGCITKAEARVHPCRNKLTHAVGIQEELVSIGYKSGSWQSNQLFLLATDGLAYWDEPKKLSMILGNARTPSHAVWLLKNASLKERGEDNVTIAIVGSPGIQRGKKKFIHPIPFLTDWNIKKRFNKTPPSVKWGSE